MSSLQGTSRCGRDVRGWVHFGIAAGLLGASAAGFEFSARVLNWAMQKESVPWPKNVVVDPETFRLQILPDAIGNGRYVLAEDGELTGSKDGLPDGEREVADDVREALSIGTSWDKKRVGQRCSNWLLVRTYRDNTMPVGHPLRYWGLEIYYYTGALDTVPHVPERCLVAGGGTLVNSGDLRMSVPAAPSPWDEPLKIRRTVYEMTDQASMVTRQYVQYYVFSLNGRPETSWEMVRLNLAYPWVRYCYLAKVQVYPYGPAENVAEVDKAAEDLIAAFLPTILQAIPMPQAVEALESAAKGK